MTHQTPPGAAGERSPAPGEQTDCAAPGCASTNTRPYPGPPLCKEHALAAGLLWPDPKPPAPPAERDWRITAYHKVIAEAQDRSTP